MLIAALVIMNGCATTGSYKQAQTEKPYWERIRESKDANKKNVPSQTVKPKAVFTRQDGDPGQNVLAAGYRMAFEEKRIVTGSCWDFVHAVYNEAGYPDGNRTTVFHGMQEGPYADPEQLQPGDWVMHWNMEYMGGKITHSSIFVEWKDRGRHIAKTLDYAGMNRNVTGRFTEHKYEKVFGIVRGGK